MVDDAAPFGAVDEPCRYAFRLMIAGTTPRSASAIVNVRQFCEQHLNGLYDLEVIDIAQHPELAAREQVIAVPTLIRTTPLPIRRFIGDMSQTDRILAGLGLEPAG